MALVIPRSQAVVAVDADGKFIDCGRWRAKGITHWHLVSEEWHFKDNKIRFDNDRVRAARMKPYALAFSPREACDWIIGAHRVALRRASNQQRALEQMRLLSEADWFSRAEATFFLLMHGHVAGGGVLLSDTRTADAVAHPMTQVDCGACVTKDGAWQTPSP